MLNLMQKNTIERSNRYSTAAKCKAPKSICVVMIVPYEDTMHVHSHEVTGIVRNFRKMNLAYVIVILVLY